MLQEGKKKGGGGRSAVSMPSFYLLNVPTTYTYVHFPLTGVCKERESVH